MGKGAKVQAVRWCPACQKKTLQVYYPDHRPGTPYAYFQCEECGTCWYKCPVHRTFTADWVSEDEERCSCYVQQEAVSKEAVSHKPSAES